MPKLNIVGWRPGLQKISMNDVLRVHFPLGLKDAKGCVDAVLAGQSVSFTFDDSSKAMALAQALADVGAVVEIENTETAPRCIEGET